MDPLSNQTSIVLLGRDADTQQQLAGKGLQEQVQIFMCERRVREKEDVPQSFFFLFLLRA